MKRGDSSNEQNPLTNILGQISNGLQTISTKINQRITQEKSTFIKNIDEMSNNNDSSASNITFTTLKGIRLTNTHFRPRM